MVYPDALEAGPAKRLNGNDPVLLLSDRPDVRIVSEMAKLLFGCCCAYSLMPSRCVRRFVCGAAKKEPLLRLAKKSVSNNKYVNNANNNKYF